MRTRRSFLLVATLMLVFAASHVAADSPVRNVNVVYDGEAYVLDAVMFAPVPQAAAWDVLTDFDRMADWVPNTRESRVLKREGNSATIEQRGVAKYGVASFPYTTERRMDMNKPVSIRATQVKGSLRRVESLMTLDPEGDGTRLTYHLEIVPSLLAATVISKTFLEHEIPEQFGAIIGEMVRRAK